MLRRKESGLKTILQVSEEEFRVAGKHGSVLISILREREDWIKGNYLTVDTKTFFTNKAPLIVAFNAYLKKLRFENIIRIQIILDN